MDAATHETLGFDWQLRVARRVASELCSIVLGGVPCDAELASEDAERYVFRVQAAATRAPDRAALLVTYGKVTGVASCLPSSGGDVEDEDARLP